MADELPEQSQKAFRVIVEERHHVTFWTLTKRLRLCLEQDNLLAVSHVNIDLQFGPV